MDAITLQKILQTPENELVDFKSEHYFQQDGSEWDKDKPKTNDFIKDILSLMNTIRDKSAYIVIGIQDKTHEVLGIYFQIDSRRLHSKFDYKCNYAPRFLTYPLQYEGKELSIIEIPVQKYPHPCVLLKTMKPDFLERNRVYYRKGDSNAEAEQDMIKAINNHLDALPDGLTALPSLENYIKSIKDDYLELQSFFVHLLGKQQQVGEIIMSARERGEQNRRGTVEELAEMIKKAERRMLITGDPGMGKTTAMQYLCLKTAQAFAPNQPASPQAPLPVYLELRRADVSVFDLLYEHLGKHFPTLNGNTIKEIAQKMLHVGSFMIFFDGLNEIKKEATNDSIVFNTLRTIVTDYGKCMFVVSSRPSEARAKQWIIPTFELEAMDDKLQNEFLQKNAQKSNTRQLIEQAKNTFADLQQFMEVPIMFLMLIRVVEEMGAVPENKKQIVERFLAGLYQLEAEKNFQFQPQQANQVLAHLAQQIVTQTESNAEITFEKATEYAQIALQQIGVTTTDTQTLLLKLCELKILKGSKIKIGFKHQWFADYFSIKQFTLDDYEF